MQSAMTVGGWDTVGGAETAHRCCYIHEPGHTKAERQDVAAAAALKMEAGRYEPICSAEPSTCNYRVIITQHGAGGAAEAPGGVPSPTETQASRLCVENIQAFKDRRQYTQMFALLRL